MTVPAVHPMPRWQERLLPRGYVYALYTGLAMQLLLLALNFIVGLPLSVIGTDSVLTVAAIVWLVFANPFTSIRHLSTGWRYRPLPARLLWCAALVCLLLGSASLVLRPLGYRASRQYTQEQARSHSTQKYTFEAEYIDMEDRLLDSGFELMLVLLVGGVLTLAYIGMVAPQQAMVEVQAAAVSM